MILKIILGFICITNVLCIGPTVKTSSGIVVGQTVNVLNQTVNQFLGIPFAEPPVGSLRFAKPKALQKPIEGVFDGTTPKNSCMQPREDSIFNETLKMSEDCLVLNVWSPQESTNGSSKHKPVMFWIYGGGFTVGSIFQMIYNGSALAAHDVVIVTTNYRLGPFGFLYGGTNHSPGNLALYDQLMALEWVGDNIHSFGGDKHQITIFGESAGSWSVSAHILSPLSKGLFSRAIMESGAHFHPKKGVLTTDEALKQTTHMGKHFNCTEETKLLDCLRDIDADLILSYTNITTLTLEGTEFLPHSAHKTFKDNKYSHDIDLIAGVTRDEGSLLASVTYKELSGDVTEEVFIELLSDSKLIAKDINREEVLDFYTKDIDKSNSSALRKAFFDFFGDFNMKCPTYLFAKYFSNNNPKQKIYFYELTYESKIADLIGCAEETMGICHGMDVEFVFGLSFTIKSQNQIKATKLDSDFSLEVMKMWTNFAKTGDPGSSWPQLIDHKTSIVKNLNPHNLSAVFVDPFKKNCDVLWDQFLERTLVQPYLEKAF